MILKPKSSSIACLSPSWLVYTLKKSLYLKALYNGGLLCCWRSSFAGSTMHSYDGLMKKAALVLASIALLTLCTAAFSFPLLTTYITLYLLLVQTFVHTWLNFLLSVWLLILNDESNNWNLVLFCQKNHSIRFIVMVLLLKLFFFLTWNRKEKYLF